MRPSATESLYKDLDIQEGAYEYSLPAAYAIRPLRLSDLEQAVALEEKGFPPHERATREKLEYRLRVCPELCAGVFLREFEWPLRSDPNTPGAGATEAPGGGAAAAYAARHAQGANSDEEDDEVPYGIVAKRSTLSSERLVGHIFATLTDAKLVTDESMTVGGHVENGSTIVMHSLVVDPEFQGRHIGYIMLKDYIQKFFGLCTADGLALLAHDELVPFYTKQGFRDEGKSASSFGGEAWRALRLPFDTYDDQVEE